MCTLKKEINELFLQDEGNPDRRELDQAGRESVRKRE